MADIADLDYVHVIQRLGATVGDTPDDVDSDPDFVPVTEGTITIVPTTPETKVMVNGAPVSVVHAPIVCTVDAQGYLSYGGTRGVWIVDLGSDKVVPPVPRDEAAYTVTYSGLKFGTQTFKKASVNINPDSVALAGADFNLTEATSLPLPAGVTLEYIQSIADEAVAAKNELLSQKGQPGGLATLDAGKKVPQAQVPDIALTTNGNRPVGKGELVLNLADYGPLGQANDAATVEAAIADANSRSNRANGEGYKGATILIPERVNLPSGTTTPILADGVFFVSAAPGQAVIQVTSGTALTWGDGTNFIKSGGTRGIKFAAAPGGVDVTQVCCAANFAGELTFYDSKVAKVGQFVRAGESTTAQCHGVTINGVKGTAANVGVALIDLRYGTGAYLDDISVVVSGVGYPTTTTETHASVGTAGTFANGSGTGVASGRIFLRIATGSWDTVKTGDQILTNRFDQGISIYAAAGTIVGNVMLQDPVFDYCATAAISIVGSGGIITKFTCQGGYLVATDGHVCRINSTGGMVEQFAFTDTMFLFAGKSAFRSEGSAAKVSLLNCVNIGANRLDATNVAAEKDAVIMYGSDWQIIGGQFGLDGQPYTGFANKARIGLDVASSSDRYKVIGAALDGTLAASNGLTTHTSGGAARVIKGVTTVSGDRLNGTTTAPYTVGASNTSMTNNLGFSVIMYVSGGTVTDIKVNGVSTGLTSGMVTLAPGDVWAVVYSLAPTVIRQVLS